jgi:VanZ family protein
LSVLRLRRVDRLRALAFGGWCLAWLAVAWAMLHPAPPAMPGLSDKLVHFASFAAVSFATVSFCRRQRQFLVAGGFCAVAGIGFEVAQGFIATRRFEWGDVAANLGGTVLGLTLAMLVVGLLRGRWRRSRRETTGGRGRVRA